MRGKCSASSSGFESNGMEALGPNRVPGVFLLQGFSCNFPGTKTRPPVYTVTTARPDGESPTACCNIIGERGDRKCGAKGIAAEARFAARRENTPWHLAWASCAPVFVRSASSCLWLPSFWSSWELRSCGAEHNWEVFAMKVVVVKGSKFWGFVLRKMFHIKKEA